MELWTLKNQELTSLGSVFESTGFDLAGFSADGEVFALLADLCRVEIFASFSLERVASFFIEVAGGLFVGDELWVLVLAGGEGWRIRRLNASSLLEIESVELVIPEPSARLELVSPNLVLAHNPYSLVTWLLS